MRSYHLFFMLIGFMLFTVLVIDDHEERENGHKFGIAKNVDVGECYVIEHNYAIFRPDFRQPFSQYRPPIAHTGIHYEAPKLEKPHYIFAYSKRV